MGQTTRTVDVGCNCMYFYTSTGVAAILAQFNINQFRSIAWYNVALGVVFVMLEFLIFHGERKCPDFSQQCNFKKSYKWKNADVILILISFLLFG